jgi:hypothetical protein
MIEDQDDMTLVYMWAYKQAEKKYKARIEQLEAALRKIADCDVPREHVKIYRKDGVLSKHDGCEHGRPMYEDCDICTANFARAALGEKKDG